MTIAAFLNTEGGDLLIGVDPNGTVLGIEHDRAMSTDEFVRQLMQLVREHLGEGASACIDPSAQIVEATTICLVSCRRSPEPVRLPVDSTEPGLRGAIAVRRGNRSVLLKESEVEQFLRERFDG